MTRGRAPATAALAAAFAAAAALDGPARAADGDAALLAACDAHLAAAAGPGAYRRMAVLGRADVTVPFDAAVWEERNRRGEELLFAAYGPRLGALAAAAAQGGRAEPGVAAALAKLYGALAAHGGTIVDRTFRVAFEVGGRARRGVCVFSDVAIPGKPPEFGPLDLTLAGPEP